MLVIVVAVMVGIGAFVWFGCRIEVESGELAVLTAKTGRDLPSGAILAEGPEYMGIQLKVLSEGRFFRNPFFWAWDIFPITTIPAGHVGILTRRFGQDISSEALAAGQLFAKEGQKGLLREVYNPGNYRINPYAYDVEIAPAIEIPAGFVGIVTELAGTAPDDNDSFIVKPGEKGVQPVVLQPGTYYVNPYAQRIDLMDIRSQRHEMFGENALQFPTSDGFDMRVLLIVEWAVDFERAPEVLVRIGEMGASEDSNDILQKIVVPAIRGYGRIIGSQYSAPEYISGTSRIVFQSNLYERVRQTCAGKGVEIKSVLIADIDPPEEIARPIREREVAKEELSRNEARILQAQAEQTLARTEAMITQEKRRVEAETDKLRAVISATNMQVIALVEQDQKLAVAQTDLQAAELEAEATRDRGKAKADVIVLGHQAEAQALAKSVQAFGSGAEFAKYQLTRALADNIDTVFTTDDSPIGSMLSPGQ